MASFKAKFPVLKELFAKNHRGPLGPPSGARVKQGFRQRRSRRPSDEAAMVRRRPDPGSRVT